MRSARAPLWICLLTCLPLAFALRVGLALDHVHIQRPDEVFETLEPAHRLWSGWGVVTWEWRDGIRSWLFPGFLAGLMTLTNAVGLGGESYLDVIAITLSLASLGVVAIAVVLGWGHFGLAGAVLCGIPTAIWPDLIYFAPKTLTEAQGGTLLAVAAGFASLPPAPAGGNRPFALAAMVGLLLGIVFCLRFQLAPAELVVAALIAGRYGRRGCFGLLAGGALPVLALGICDALTWGSPFQSVWKNLYVNGVEHRSAQYGRFPWYWYGWEFIRLSGGAALPAILFFCAGARVAPALALVAIVTVLSHSFIAHKEISFIFAAVPACVIVIGLGTARLLEAVLRRRPDISRRGALGFAAALWAAVIALNVTPASTTDWNAVSRDIMPLWLDARTRPDLCGLALYGADFPWYDTGGYTFLNRPVPIFLLRAPHDLDVAGPAFNYLIVGRNDAMIVADDDTILCTQTFCLLRRKQSCAPREKFNINEVLAREGG